jgi:two-component sensor histidine kinase
LLFSREASSLAARLRAVVLRWLDPLRNRLMLLFGILVLPPTLVSVAASFDAHNEMVARVRETAEHFALLASTYERTIIDQSQNLLDNVAGDPALRALKAANATTSDCDKLLRSAIEPNPIYASLIAFKRDGSVYCSSNPAFADAHTTDLEWFQEVVHTKAGFLSSSVVRGGEVRAIVLARPLPTSGADVEGVLALSIDAAKLQPFERFQGLPNGGAIYLLDRRGAVLTGLEHPMDISERGMPARAIAELIDPQRLTITDAKGRDGVERFYAATPMRAGAMFILVGLPNSEATGWLRQDLPIQLTGILAMWAAGVLAAWLGTRIIVTRWTKQLTDTAKEMSKGDLSVRADLAGAPVEIRRVGDTLGEMAARLEAQRRDLQAAVDEKDTLLREIHHRVKNNLQTVISLLNLQTKGIRLESARLALQQLKMRIQTLGLVHRHLYESDNLKTVDLKTFLGELCRLLQDASGAPYWRVRVDLDIARVSLQIERAIPLALLVTELATNSFKHAFPEGRVGTIGVKLAAEDDTIVLTVADDGVGTSPPQEGDGSEDRSGLGLVLTQALAKQLGGTLTTSGPPGTATTLSFPLNPPPHGVATGLDDSPAEGRDAGMDDAPVSAAARANPAA